jgi:PAS domain S-box-containing protein
MNNFHKDLDDIRFRVAVEAAPNAMIMTDENGIIVLANQQTEQLFGYTKEELLGQTIELLVPMRYREQHPKDRSQFWNNPAPRRMGTGRDLYGIRKDQKEVPIEIGLTPIVLSAGRYVISAIVDITERRFAENALHAKTAELARSNAELEQFAYVASHDLQAPLRHITSYVQLLNKELDTKLDDKTKQWMGFVVDGAKRMQLLINGLLSFSRVSRGNIILSWIDLNSVIENSLKNLSNIITESEAEIIVQPMPKIHGDALIMQQLFQNLIENAIKFKKINTKPKVQISYKELEKEFVFTVQDNGIGIEDEFKEQIFVIFQRLHSADEYPGTGIGLAICKKIVDFHGGKIWIESPKGEGTRFHFSIIKKIKE